MPAHEEFIKGGFETLIARKLIWKFEHDSKTIPSGNFKISYEFID